MNQISIDKEVMLRLILLLRQVIKCPISLKIKYKLWFNMTTRFRCVDCNKTVFYCVKEKWTRKLIEFFHYNRLFTQARSTVLKKNRGKGGGISHHICYNFYLYVKFIFNFSHCPKQGRSGTWKFLSIFKI